MILAFCLFNYFPHGGLQRDFLQIAKACIVAGHNVDVYTMDWQGDRHDLPIHIVPVFARSNHQKALRFSRKMQEILSQKKYDAVVGFNKMAGLDIYYAADACFKDKALSRSFLYRLSPRCRVFSRLEWLTFLNSKTQILLLNEAQQQVYAHHYPDAISRFHLLPPSIQHNNISESEQVDIRQRIRSEFAIKNDEFLLLMVCSKFHTKGVDRAIKALASLPAALLKKTKLYIVGNDKQQKMQKLANKLNVDKQIVFLGARDDVLHLMLAADLLVHPARVEAGGIVLLEAIVSGLPILTTDVCGYAEHVIAAASGVVFTSPFEQRNLDNSLQQMLGLKNLTACRQASLQYSQKMNFTNNASKISKQIERFARKKHDQNL